MKAGSLGRLNHHEFRIMRDRFEQGSPLGDGMRPRVGRFRARPTGRAAANPKDSLLVKQNGGPAPDVMCPVDTEQYHFVSSSHLTLTDPKN